MSNVDFAAGPGNKANSAVEFRGMKNSFIEIPNNGALDTKYSMTFAFYILCEKEAYGPIFAYNGVQIWKTQSGNIYGSFSESDNIYISVIKRKSWQFIAISCNFEKGTAYIYHNGRVVKHVNFRVNTFRSTIRKTSGPVRMGAHPDHTSYFRGRVSCMQLYGSALSRSQLERAQTLCECDGENRRCANHD